MVKGSLVAIVTPMKSDGTLAIGEFERLIDWHLAAGTEGLVVAGTTGESPTLSLDETRELVAVALSRVGGRIPVLAGSGTNSTEATIRRSQAMARAGADACLVVTPYYNKPSQEGMFRHYEAVAHAIDIPVVLYNVPGRTGCDLLPATTARLAAIDNIVAIKEATAGTERVTDIRNRCGPAFTVLSGDDATAREAILAGARGVISVTANVVPEPMRLMCAKALAGEVEEAKQIDNEISDLHNVLLVEANPIPVKWALQQMGMISSGIRLPLTPLAVEHHARVARAMTQAGLERRVA